MTQISPIALLLRAAAVDLAPLELEPGAELVARVVEEPSPNGTGVLSLAGALQQAKLPPGVRAGQKLTLRVERTEADAIVLRVVHGSEKPSASSAPAPSTAGRLAVRGDGDLIHGALALAAGGPMVLPDGRVAEVRVEDDEESARGREQRATAKVVLHSPDLGPIELRLDLGPGAVVASVHVEPGRAASLADAGAADLARALERASARRASVGVVERTPDEPRPAPPRARVKEVFDRYA
jgi:hypothetical protein